MLDDVCQHLKAHVESVVSAKMGELEERLSMPLSGCAKEAWAKDESDALKVLLAGVETHLREEHAALVDAINEQKTMMSLQTSLLEALNGEVKAMDEKVDGLCSHLGRLGDIEGDVATTTKSVQDEGNEVDAVSSFVLGLNERIDNIRLVDDDEGSDVRKSEEAMRTLESFHQREGT